MRPEQDAYGQLILDGLKGKKSEEVCERDDGFVASSMGALAYLAPYRKWPRHQKQALKFARGRVLDIGCGGGRVSLYLQGKGHRVTAVDVSPGAVKATRQRGVRDARQIPIERLGPKLGTFDTIVMYGNNFGLMGNPQRGKRFLKRWLRMTSPHARIIVESCNPYRTKDPVHKAYHRFNRKRGRLPGGLRLRVRYKTYCSPWFDYLLASPAEMRAIVRGTGWRVQRTFETKPGMYSAVIVKA